MYNSDLEGLEKYSMKKAPVNEVHGMKNILVLIMALVIAPMAFAQGSYRIQAGDTLAISVLEDPNLNRSVLVRPDGGISLPIAGNIQAGGNSIAAVERLVTERLASGFSIKPTVSVALAAVGPVANAVAQARAADAANTKVDVFFIGEVNGSGTQQIERGTTLLQAIAAAGGLTPFAADKRIQLRRTDRTGRETIFLFNYDAVENGAQIANNLVVQEGDVIIVPERKLFE